MGSPSVKNDGAVKNTTTTGAVASTTKKVVAPKTAAAKATPQEKVADNYAKKQKDPITPETASAKLPPPEKPRPKKAVTDKAQLAAEFVETFDSPYQLLAGPAFFLSAPFIRTYDWAACHAHGANCEDNTDPTNALALSIVERLKAEKNDPGLADFEKSVVLSPAYREDSVSLPDFMRALKNEKSTIAPQLAKKLDGAVPAAAVKLMLDDYRTLMLGLVMTPKDMRDVFVKLNDAHVRSGEPLPPHEHAINAGHVDLDHVDWNAISPSKNEMTRLADNLYYGEVSAEIPIDVERRNIVWAEVLQRLSENSGQAQPSFSVTYQGQSYTRLDAFLNALRATGHTVNVSIRMQVADLTDLSRKTDGRQKKAAAPTFARSGITDAKGREALIPLMHDELAIVITPPAGAKPGDPRYLQGDARWYQGINQIGFFPASVTVDSAWTSGKELATLKGDLAVQAAVRASYYGDNIATLAHDANMRVDGYGIMGNCGDSVMAAVYDTFQGDLSAKKDLEMNPRLAEMLAASKTRTFAYPYLIGSERIANGLQARQAAATKAGKPQDAAVYAALAEAARKLPDDAAGSISSVEQRRDLARRALQIIELTWPDESGKDDPFEAITHARKTLREFLKTTPAAV